MKRLLVAAFGALLVLSLVPVAAAAGNWMSSVAFSNQVASSPTTGGGYPIPAGQTAPVPGTCRLGDYDANRSESWVAVQPGTENLVGASKFFFEKYSTFYDFHLGTYTIPNGSPGGNVQLPGYDCISTGTQAMPPSWTNNTDPNVDFDTKGRAYQVTLPFNAYWVNLHPNGAIGVTYSDDLGRSWTVGNGGAYLDFLPNSTSLSLGDVVDKQWVAVNHIVGSKYQDHVYAMWSTFNGFTTKLRVAVSRAQLLQGGNAERPAGRRAVHHLRLPDGGRGRHRVRGVRRLPCLLLDAGVDLCHPLDRRRCDVGAVRQGSRRHPDGGVAAQHPLP